MRPLILVLFQLPLLLAARTRDGLIGLLALAGHAVGILRALGVTGIVLALQLVGRLLDAVLIARRALLAGLAGLALSTPVLLALVALANPYAQAELGYAADRSTAVALRDSAGRWIGVMPPSQFRDWSDGTRLPPDHAAVIPAAIPPVWRACMVHLEDRAFDGMSRRLGIDPVQILKSGVQTLTGQRRRGASTLIMQVVRTLDGRAPDADATLSDTVLRKGAELVGATALAAVIAHRDAGQAERFIAMHLPLVIGAGGSRFGPPLHGIVIASEILFGREPETLDPARQAVLAAAVKTPILFSPPGDAAGAARAARRWERVRTRAAFCLNHVLAERPEARAAAQAQLASLARPEPQIDPDLAALLPAEPRRAWQISANPVRRAGYFAGSELRHLRTEISRAAGPDWRGRVAALTLTTDAAEQVRLDRRVAAALGELRANLDGLSAELRPGAADRAELYLALVDPEGYLVRFHASRGGFYEQRAGIASTAKLVAAAALGRVDEPSTFYCRPPIPDRVDPKPDARPEPTDCGPSTSITARGAMAHSDNRAIHWALRSRRRALAAAHSLADALGVAVPGLSPATALTLGLAELTPAEQLRVSGALGHGLAGLAEPVGLPRLIARLQRLDPATGTLVAFVPAPVDPVPGPVVAGLFTDHARVFFRGVVGAVAAPGGTLAALSVPAGRLSGELLAKTGTLSVQGATHHVHIAGLLMRDRRPWGLLISLGPGRAGAVLGHHLSAGWFAPLAAALLAAEPPVAPRTVPQLTAKR